MSNIRVFRVPALFLGCGLALAWSPACLAQQGGEPRPGPMGMPMIGGPGMGGPGMQHEQKVLEKFDADGNGWLNAQERAAARTFLEEQQKNSPRGQRGPGMRPPGGGMGGPGGAVGPGMFGGRDEAASPGPKVSPADAPALTGDLYDTGVLRTIFIDFESADWEKELETFRPTDVEVSATITVDGKKYPLVGVSFRGASSYFGVRTGSKRSLAISMDMADHAQRLGAYKSLNLLNAHEDPTFLHSVLYLNTVRKFVPAPKANFVRVVINGESWGVYSNAQQFDKEFLRENFGSSKGTRWKVPGSPAARGGLEYLGEEIAAYRAHYQMKGEDNEKAWKAFIHLCKVLNQTPTAELESAIRPILDVDAVLWFLALDNALINGDGYWVRSSDYSIYLDHAGKFHIIPHDANETFGAPPGGPMMGGMGGMRPRRDENMSRLPDDDDPPAPRERQPTGGRGGRGLDLDPLIGMNDAAKPLRSKLLAVPALRAQYLAHVKQIAEDVLDWSKLGPEVARYRGLIDEQVKLDTKKLSSYESFLETTSPDAPTPPAEGRRPQITLRAFADQRRAYLLNYPGIKELAISEKEKRIAP